MRNPSSGPSQAARRPDQCILIEVAYIGPKGSSLLLSVNLVDKKHDMIPSSIRDEVSLLIPSRETTMNELILYFDKLNSIAGAMAWVEVSIQAHGPGWRSCIHGSNPWVHI